MENKLDIRKFKNHSPSPWVINSPSMTLNSGSTVMAELHVNDMVEPDDYCLIAAAPELLAELKEARKEIEKLRSFIWLAKQHGSNALISVENDTDGPGCCQGIANMLAALEGWDGKE